MVRSFTMPTKASTGRPTAWSICQHGENALPSTGIPYVVVNGTVVVKDSKVRKGVYTGQTIRQPVVH
jgi:hypothetical protein